MNHVHLWCRWFPAEQVRVPQAQFLDIILYSREQLAGEYAAMPDAKGDPALLPRAPWGIISIKAQVVPLSDSPRNGQRWSEDDGGRGGGQIRTPQELGR